MITANYFSIRNLIRALTYIGLFGYGMNAISNEQNSENIDFKVRVAVEEMRLDAVVLDRKGSQVTNLTIDDFEIRQDGVPQKLISAIYINENQAQPKAQPGVAKGSKLSPPIPTPMLTSKDVRRTFVFVIENIDIEFAQIYDARRALRKFVETQMQPGDLVAIVPTAGGDTEIQTFASNKQHLFKIIDNLQWSGWSKKGISYTDVAAIGNTDRYERYDPMIQLSAIGYCINVLQDIPGRKSLILISRNVMIESRNIYEYERLQTRYNLLADAALRAGVVIHTLDIEQLSGPEKIYEEFGAEHGLIGDSNSVNDGSIFRKRDDRVSKIVALAINGKKRIPLSEKTGGLFLTDSNYSSSPSGIGRASEMIKGYYLLTYIPPADTFNKDAQKSYLSIRIKVKKPGCEVHSRDGFYRTPTPLNTSSEKPVPLKEAIFSPFRYNDLKVDIASGYIDDQRKGYLLQSWLYVDAKDLSINEAKEGMHSISLEGACITSNIDNIIQDSSTRRYDYYFKNEDLSWIKEHGLRFSLTLPIKKPGAYYIRAAMKDLGSGKIGSAYQFIDVPDLKKGHLSLSNIFIVNRDDDMPWARTNNSELSPDVRRDSRKSAALRSYKPGETIEYVVMIYNAEVRAKEKPDLQSQFALFGNGKELFKSEIAAVDLSGATDFQRIPIQKTLALGKSIELGDYVLQLQVSDKQANKKNSLATQTLNFKVIDK
jgi:VWFA-related protein